MIQLSPDEAQYWLWSQQLDWGYYSKPPGIAWQIWFTTTLFGSHEFGVRIGAIVIGFILALTVYHLAQACRLSEKASFWSALIFAFSPLGFFLSFAATTDVGATLFLTLAIAEIAYGLEERQAPNYFVAGLWILCGALYKWTAYIFWPITGVMILFQPRLRKWSLLWGILVSLLGLLPSLYWNMTHDWATFKHVGSSLAPTHQGGNVLDFFFAQMGLLSPIFFVLMILSFFLVRRPALVYLALFPGLIVFYVVSACFKKIQPNWGIFLYPPATVLIAWCALARIRLGRVWLHVGIWLAILGTVGALSIPWLQKYYLFQQYPISYKANPFRQNVGWDRLAPALMASGYRPAEAFLFGDKYQTTSLLSFYGPEQQRAYFFNLNQQRKNQFSYGPRMEDCETGRTGYCVVIENARPESLGWYQNHYPKKLSPYFEHVVYAGSYPLFSAYGHPVKHAIIFRCENYCGTCPLDPEKY